ncbi:MAG: hypothetical protein HFH45_05615 [Bacilli bacterium]|nr:hypothetical protein [Bacilli bacterium]
MDKLKQIIFLILGIMITIGVLFVFFYGFIFVVIIGLIYYIYRKITKKLKPKNKTKEKQVGPVIIDMEEDE